MGGADGGCSDLPGALRAQAGPGAVVSARRTGGRLAAVNLVERGLFQVVPAMAMASAHSWRSSGVDR